MIKTIVNTSLGVIVAATLLAGGASTAFAAPAGKPLNAGKDGTKSNAGAGNGAEAGEVIAIIPSVTTTNSPTYTVSGEVTTVYEPLPTTTVITSKVATGTPYNAGGSKNSALKQDYVVTTTTTSWDGEKYVETTQTEIWQEKTTSTVTTTTYEELDPGRSAEHNQSPEGSTVSEVSDPVVEITQEFVAEGEPVVETVGDFESTVDTKTATVTEPYSPNSQGNP